MKRTRVPRPAGLVRLRWDESLHEGGHALMTFCLGEAVVHVYMPGPGAEHPYTRHVVMRLSLGGLALVGVAGVAAERSRGKRSAKFPATDREALVGVGIAKRRTLEALAEDFFRLPEVAALLDRAAQYLYPRWGTGTIPGEDILAAIGERGKYGPSFPKAVDAAAEHLLDGAESLLDEAKTKRTEQRVDHQREEIAWVAARNRLGVRETRGETPRPPLPDRRTR